MALSKIDGSASVGTSEYSFPNASTSLAPVLTDAIVQPFVDVSAMVAGDQYQMRIYERLNGGTQRVVYESILTGAQNPPIWVAPSMLLMDGWDITAKKLAGTDRTLVSSIRQVT